MPFEPSELPESDVYDVLIVGGGPNGLALASRLCEPRPVAFYTDLEIARLRYLGGSRTGRIASGQRKLACRCGPKALASMGDVNRVGVIDAAGNEWLATWKTVSCSVVLGVASEANPPKYFDQLEISHLRSPMFFHGAPADVDALVSFAYSTGRSAELREIPGCVGKEASKHAHKRQQSKRPTQASFCGRPDPINERDRQDYFVPSAPLFNDFVDEELVDRYNMAEMVRQGHVTSLRYHEDVQTTEGVRPGCFELAAQTAEGGIKTLAARVVVFAIGTGAQPSIPAILQADKGKLQGPGWCHSGAFARRDFQFPPPALQESIASQKPMRMLVIGGGLTSAQIADLAISRGVSHVTLICRSYLKVKPFDLDLEWITKYQNLQKMIVGSRLDADCADDRQWHQEDSFEARVGMFKKAKGGGSLTPYYHTICKRRVKEGRLAVMPKTSIAAARYENDRWRVQLHAEGQDVDAPERQFDYIVAATGNTMDLASCKPLKRLFEEHPIPTVNGFPLLSDDLQWGHIPLYMMGGYALLPLGPGAFNLSSTREASERITNALVDSGMVRGGSQEASDAVIHGGLFDALAQE